MSQKVYIETYGCQMNLGDTEIVRSVLVAAGYEMTETAEGADYILMNTCSVRDNAERKILEKLTHFKRYKKKNRNLKVGLLGCMAERMRETIFEQRDIVDLVVGPDEYRRLPEIFAKTDKGEKGIAVRLITAETYDDIEPLRTEGRSAWIAVMRGCNNFCSYCVVPYTRGRERSRPAGSLIKEIEKLAKDGYREVTMLGQNVNSYRDETTGADFADLLAQTAAAVPEMWIRYVTSHPRDMSDKLIEIMARFDNICKYIHLPVQSGSDRVLSMMNRGYTAEHYLGRIKKIRESMPGVALSTDIIAGFPGETLDDHSRTLEILEQVRYDGAYMFRYSPREGTKAWNMPDDVHEEEKIRRLNEIIDLQQSISKDINKGEAGRLHKVLVEGESKRRKEDSQGRTDTNKLVIFPNADGKVAPGEFANVRILRSTAATLFGEIE